jgi:hypothetical protein
MSGRACAGRVVRIIQAPITVPNIRPGQQATPEPSSAALLDVIEAPGKRCKPTELDDRFPCGGSWRPVAMPAGS